MTFPASFAPKYSRKLWLAIRKGVFKAIFGRFFQHCHPSLMVSVFYFK